MGTGPRDGQKQGAGRKAPEMPAIAAYIGFLAEQAFRIKAANFLKPI